jgi:histidinol-phosphatase
MNPWDIAAVVPCVEEAGGLATTASGRREGVIEGGSLLTSCGGPLHDELVEILRPLPAD